MHNKKPLEYEEINGCFIVTSHAVDNHGYPILSHNKRQYRAHQLIYSECYGDIPVGHVVRHKCDNRLCANPEHLESGTPQQNVEDRVNRGRGGHGMAGAKVTPCKVREIRRSVAQGATQKEIAERYKLSKGTVSLIVRGITWKEVV